MTLEIVKKINEINNKISFIFGKDEIFLNLSQVEGSFSQVRMDLIKLATKEERRVQFLSGKVARISK